MSIPIHLRGFDAFLSHAHVDQTYVNTLYDWLTRVAGLEVWYDAKQMAGGTAIATGLHSGIETCRALILVGSQAALKSGWVRKEINVAQDEQTRSSEFRIVPIIIGDATPEAELRGISWIKSREADLDFETAINILRALHPSAHLPNPRNSRDVYISASWHVDDNMSAKAICECLASNGFRMVGDSKTQQDYGQKRIEQIIASCGALVCIIPYRGEVHAQPTDGPYRYLLRELDIARQLSVPTLVFADPRVQRSDCPDSTWHPFETTAVAADDATIRQVKNLHEQWREPDKPHYVFLATDLDSQFASRNSDIRRLIESITGMSTRVGPDIEDDDIPRGIINSIKNSFLTIADITGDERSAFNIDVCIEAGIASALNANLRMIAYGEDRRPPFMLRSAGQLKTYRSDVEYCGLMRRLCWPFRRRIINGELNTK